MLSRSCEYSIRAVLYIALHGDETNKIGIKQIVKDLKLPAHFLGKTLQFLTKKNLLSSSKGPNGGFYLNNKQKNRPLMDIVETIDGTDVFQRCVLGLDQCSDKRPCPVHDNYKDFRNNLKQTFKNYKIKDLTSEINVDRLYL